MGERGKEGGNKERKGEERRKIKEKQEKGILV